MRFTTSLFADIADTPRYKAPHNTVGNGIIILSDRVTIHLPEGKSEALRYITALKDALLIARDTIMFPDSEDTTPTTELPKSDTLHNGTYE